jgi:AraC-like DNA-binding protein
VLDRRLARAHRMLADRRHADWAVSAIAFESGFGNLSYFNRMFRRRYSSTPSDVRAMHNERKAHQGISRCAFSQRP